MVANYVANNLNSSPKIGMKNERNVLKHDIVEGGPKTNLG